MSRNDNQVGLAEALKHGAKRRRIQDLKVPAFDSVPDRDVKVPASSTGPGSSTDQPLEFIISSTAPGKYPRMRQEETSEEDGNGRFFNFIKNGVDTNNLMFVSVYKCGGCSGDGVGCNLAGAGTAEFWAPLHFRVKEVKKLLVEKCGYEPHCFKLKKYVSWHDCRWHNCEESAAPLMRNRTDEHSVHKWIGGCRWEDPS